ncbi:nucleotidyl transferase AbiEii/AbiGii toxin family protein [Spirosoma aerophilum]
MLHTEVLEPGTLGILRSILANESFESFNLVGGTALALQFGHRLSIDLDFFTTEPFDKELVKAELNDIGEWTTDSENKIGLRGQLNGVKMDFITYRYPLISPIVVIDDVRMLSQSDISAMKLSAVTNRGAKKDFFDIYFLLRRHSFAQLCDWYMEKFRTNNLFMLLKSITYFDDAELSEMPVMLADNVSWETVKSTILLEVATYS